MRTSPFHIRTALLAVGALALGSMAATVVLWPHLRGTASADDTDFRSPAAVHAPNDWVAATRAFTSDDADTTTDVSGDQQGYAEFSLAVPSASMIIGIEVQVETFSEDDSGCQLQVSLSGNDGGGYSSVRTADLTNADVIHTLGGTTDLWGDTWSPSEFSNANFVAKVRYNDPGAGCTDGSTASLDHIQVNVYYKALQDTGLGSPSATQAPNGWTNPTNAFTSNNVRATASADDADQGYTDFGLSVPAASTVKGIEVRVEASSSDPSGCELQVRLSGDDGGNFTTRKTAALTDTETVHTLGGPDDLWGDTWSVGEFSNANFVAEVRNNEGAGCVGGSTTSLDRIQVNVFYKPLAETGLSSPDLTHLPNGWTDPNNALTGNDLRATASADNADQGYADFDFSVPAASIIFGIEVRVEASSSDADGCQLQVRLSGDDGVNFTPSYKDVALSGVETVHTLGGSDDLWGDTWSASEFSNATFVAEVRNNDPGAGCDGGSPTTSLDHIQVNVFYKPLVDTGLSSPDATHVPNQWTDPENAFASDNNRATETTNGQEQGYADFDFSVSASAVITGIEVRVEAFASDASGCELKVWLSGDDGATYSPAQAASLTGVETVHILGGTGDTWSEAWSAGEFSNANFVAKVENVDPGAGCDDGFTASLDRIQVNVFTKPAGPSPTATRTATRTPTSTATRTPTITGTPPTATATRTPTATTTPTVTNTATPTRTSTPTITPVPTATPTHTNTPVPTNTPAPTNTPTFTPTPPPTNTPTRTPTPRKPIGDVNGDGRVDSRDALLILQFTVQIIDELPNAASADVDLSGEVNPVDATLILQLEAGIIGRLPV